MPHIPLCKGMHATTNLRVESAALQIRGIREIKTYYLTDVKITDNVPEVKDSLPDTLVLEERENFRDIKYPTIDRDRCDMLIGIDNVNLIEAVDEPYSHRVSDSLHA